MLVNCLTEYDINIVTHKLPTNNSTSHPLKIQFVDKRCFEDTGASASVSSPSYPGA